MRTADLPPLKALRAFEAVARCGSVTGAAAQLNVTHGAVSRQLRLLDDALGQRLFTRSGRGLELTDVGNQLHEHAGAAFDRLRDVWRDLRASPASGALVLGCPGSVLARWVIPRLERLAHDLPSITLHLAAREEPLDPALTGLDAALLLAAPPWPPLWQVIELAPERIGPVLSPHYAGWPRLKNRGAAALCDEPVLRTRSRPQAWPDWAHRQHVTLAGANTGAEFPHLYHLLEAALAGLGVAIAPQPLVVDELAAGRLLAPWGFVETDARWVLARPRKSTDERIDALASWLSQALANYPSAPTNNAGSAP